MTNTETAYEPRLRDTPFSLMQVGTIFRNVSEKVDPHLYEPLSVGQLGVTPQLEGVAQQQGDGEKKLVRPGQIAMNSRSDRRGASGLSEYEGVVSVVYTVLQPDLNYVYPRFAHYLFRSLDFQNEYYRWGTGIVDDLWSTKFERLAQIRIPLPDLETQHRIADYLDREISEMDALLEEFEGLVGKLQSRKQSLVINTFFDTDFSNPVFIDLSTSRYPTIPLKHASPYRIGWTPASNNTSFYGDGYKWAKISDLGKKYISETDTQITEMAVTERGKPTPAKPGDLLFSFKLSVGTVSLVQEEMFTNEAIAAFSPTPKMDMNFAYYAYPVYLQVNANTNIYGAPLLNSQIFSRARVPNLPIEEQRRIAEKLDREFERMDILIEESTRLIENLKARKTALITEVVTGRKEV